MSKSSHELVAFTEERLDKILARPSMWGRAESLEMQVLLLLEILVFVEMRPSVPNPRAWLHERYAAFRHEHVRRDPPTLLAGHFADDLPGMISLLGKFRDEVAAAIRQPYEQRAAASKIDAPDLEDLMLDQLKGPDAPMPRAEG